MANSNGCEFELVRSAKGLRGEEENTSVDRLSNLPDSILYHILSFLDIKYAVQTSVLSRVWRCVWKHVNVINLRRSNFRNVLSFTKFIKRALSHRYELDVSKISLIDDVGPHKPILQNMLDKVIGYAFTHDCQHLVIDLEIEHNYSSFYTFGSVCSDSLKSLKLRNVTIADGFGSSGLPVLTTLILDSCPLVPDREGSVDLISRFPSLVDLVVYYRSSINYTGYYRNVACIRIFGLELVKLELVALPDYGIEVVAPKLQFFRLEPYVGMKLSTAFSNLSISRLPSLYRADIFVRKDDRSHSNDENVEYGWNFLFQGLHDAHSVMLRCYKRQVLKNLCDFLEHDPPPFTKLKSLVCCVSRAKPGKVITYSLDESSCGETKCLRRRLSHITPPAVIFNLRAILMGLLNLPSKRNPKKWKLLDLVSAAFFGLVLLFLYLVFTPSGDSLAASGRQALLRSGSDPRQRHRLVALLETERHPHPIEACSAEEVDHMPCEDPRRNSQLSREMNFYRERHCPVPDETPLCLIPPPVGYRVPVQWPDSLHKIWHANMPHNKIADRKGHQGWMKREGEHFIFPGGGTMFPEGAIPYIEKLAQYVPIRNGGLRTALDMGCGVASWGGYLMKEGILPLSFAPRDSHKSQIQFALERGIPAFVAMLGTRRLPFPAFSFDLVHCSRCLIPFTAYNATYFIEVDRLLRPGGYLVISGPPVRWAKQDKEWSDLQGVARALCYELIVIDGNTAIWKKPSEDSCLPSQNEFGLRLCDESVDPTSAWYFKLEKCVTPQSSVKGKVAVGVIPSWPDRLKSPPARASLMNSGNDLFELDTRRWARRVAYYKNSLNVKLGTPSIRNVMDMNAFFGSFAAALASDPVWVMNAVPPHKPSTLDVIYDRGLIGVYHDWCEPFSTYPRTYDLIHVSGIASLLKAPGSGKNRCSLVDLMVEMDRILRPKGTVVIRDSSEVIEKVARLANAVRWTSTVHGTGEESHGSEKILIATKNLWS
ncbi:Probable pectin methyltransferase QUA3 [Linum perenne]